MPAASRKGLHGGAVAADGPRPVVDEDEVDDEDDELIDDEDDEDSLADGVDVAPAPSPTTNPTPPTSQAATLHHHHHPIPVAVAVAVAVDEEEDLPSSSSSSSAEEDDDKDNDAPPDLLPPPAPAPAAAANINPNPNPSPSSSTAIVALPTPLNGSSQSFDLDMIPASADPLSSNHTPSPKRLRTSSDDPKPTPTPPASDDSRRLFQRLWTDDDEIELLQGFLEFTSQRSALSNHHHHDTTPFYDQIKTRLQVDFNKNQLVEKLRRLKKKYRNALNRISSSKDFAFKSPHEQATFEISRKIWSAAAETTFDDNDDAGNHPLLHNGGGTAFQFDRGSSRSSSRNKRSRARSTNSVDGLPTASLGGDHPPPSVVVAGYLPPPPPPPHHHPVLAPPASSSTSLPSLIEDTVRSCLSPLFKELLHCAVTSSASSGFVGGGMPLNPLLPHLSSWSLGGVVGGGNSEGVDDRWRKQQILELEVYSKRLELVQEQIKLALEDLKSKGG